jgi:hypothetical protein
MPEHNTARTAQQQQSLASGAALDKILKRVTYSKIRAKEKGTGYGTDDDTQYNSQKAGDSQEVKRTISTFGTFGRYTEIPLDQMTPDKSRLMNLKSKSAARCQAHTRSNPIESAKSHFFDTISWGAFCDVTLTLKQARQPDSGGWVKLDDYRCRQTFRHFMNLLNRPVYGAAFPRYVKSLRVLPVLEKSEVGARALRSCERGTSGRWHIHCAIELPSHFDAIALERLIRDCWPR